MSEPRLIVECEVCGHATVPTNVVKKAEAERLVWKVGEQLREAEAERDRLLAAVERIVESAVEMGRFTVVGPTAIEKAREALSSARGEGEGH